MWCICAVFLLLVPSSTSSEQNLPTECYEDHWANLFCPNATEWMRMVGSQHCKSAYAFKFLTPCGDKSTFTRVKFMCCEKTRDADEVDRKVLAYKTVHETAFSMIKQLFDAQKNVNKLLGVGNSTTNVTRTGEMEPSIRSILAWATEELNRYGINSEMTKKIGIFFNTKGYHRDLNLVGGFTRSTYLLETAASVANEAIRKLQGKPSDPNLEETLLQAERQKWVDFEVGTERDPFMLIQIREFTREDLHALRLKTTWGVPKQLLPELVKGISNEPLLKYYFGLFRLD